MAPIHGDHKHAVWRTFFLQNAVPFAVRISDNRIVEVHEVPRGAHCGCLCLCCGEPLVSRQGDINAWHFAHHSDAQGCDSSGETYLHLAGKRALAQRIQEAIDKTKSAEMVWQCAHCEERHQGDLAKQIEAVGVEERSLGKFVPDITLYSRPDVVRSIIEIVVSNPPDQSKLDYARENEVNVVVFNISNSQDIDAILDPTKNLVPSRGNRALHDSSH